MKYRPGKKNIDVDSLSRMSADINIYMDQSTHKLSYDVTSAATQAVESQTRSSPAWSMGITAACAKVSTSTLSSQVVCLLGARYFMRKDFKQNTTSTPGET